MEILVYGFEDDHLKLLKVCDNSLSILWVRRFYSGDTFNIVVPATLDNINLFTNGRVIEIMRTTSTNVSSYCGVITSVNVVSGDDGENITVTGSNFSGLLERRILSEWAPTDTIMHALDRNAGLSAVENRRFTATVFDDTVDCPGVYTQSTEYKKLSQYVQLVGKPANFGIQSCIIHNEVDEGGATLEPYVKIYGRYAVDRSVSQQDNTPVVFSDVYENAIDFDYTYNENGAVTAITAVSPEQYDASKHIDIVSYRGYFDNGATGYNRIEKCQKIGAITTTEARGGTEEIPIMWTVLDRAATEALAKSTANTMYVLPTDNFSCSLVLNQEWGEIFDVGDVVTVQCQAWGKSVNKSVTEVSEFYDVNTTTISATLGEPPKSLIEILDSKQGGNTV